jgi:hypothetical protein
VPTGVPKDSERAYVVTSVCHSLHLINTHSLIHSPPMRKKMYKIILTRARFELARTNVHMNTTSERGKLTLESYALDHSAILPDIYGISITSITYIPLQFCPMHHKDARVVCLLPVKFVCYHSPIKEPTSIDDIVFTRVGRACESQ